MLTSRYFIQAIIALVVSTSTFASSPSAWEDFRARVHNACVAALSPDFKIKHISVDLYGTESYGYAILVSSPRSSVNDENLQVCVYGKVSKKAEIIQIGSGGLVQSLFGASAPMAQKCKDMLYIQKCSGSYASLKDCESVVISSDCPYIRAAKQNQCLAWNPDNVIKATWLGKSAYEIRGKYPSSVRVSLFDLDYGETHGGHTCKEPTTNANPFISINKAASKPASGQSLNDIKGLLELSVRNKQLQLMAYSNGAHDGSTNVANAPNQCTDLIVRYAQLLGVSKIITTKDIGNGVDAAINFSKNSGGLFSYVDGKSGGPLPMPGAVLSVGYVTTDGKDSVLAPYGHTGIVQSVSVQDRTATVTLFDQNFPLEDVNGWKTVVFTKSNGAWTGVMNNSGVAIVVQGWANPN